MYTLTEALAHFGVEQDDSTGTFEGRRGFRVIMHSPEGQDALEVPVDKMSVEQLLADPDTHQALRKYQQKLKYAEPVKHPSPGETGYDPENAGCLADIRVGDYGINKYFSEREFRDSSPEVCGHQFDDPNFIRSRDEVKKGYQPFIRVKLPEQNWDRLMRFKHQREMNFIYFQARILVLLRALAKGKLSGMRERILSARDQSFDQKLLDSMVASTVNGVRIPQGKLRDIYISRKEYNLAKVQGKEFHRTPRQVKLAEVYEQSRKLDHAQTRVLLMMVEQAVMLAEDGIRTFPKQVVKPGPTSTTLKFNLKDMCHSFMIYLRDQLREEYSNTLDEVKQECAHLNGDGVKYLDGKLEALKALGTMFSATHGLSKGE